jgi:plasmid stabilization system protein ParE
MKFYSILSPGAEADLDSASRWYLNIDIDLAFRFTLEMFTTLRRINISPYQFPVIDGTTRRALLKRFPYSIFFVLKKDYLSVIAVVHQRRSETIWMDRAKSERGP